MRGWVRGAIVFPTPLRPDHQHRTFTSQFLGKRPVRNSFYVFSHSSSPFPMTWDKARYPPPLPALWLFYSRVCGRFIPSFVAISFQTSRTFSGHNNIATFVNAQVRKLPFVVDTGFRVTKCPQNVTNLTIETLL